MKKSPQIFYSDPALFFYDSNEEKKETQQPLTSKKCLLPNIEEKPKLNSFPPPNFRKAYQKEISINTAELDNNYKHKDNNLIDSVKNSDIPAIPTEKFQSQNFLFQNSNDRPTPNSSNRTILSLEFLKTKLGNEKFTKMVELIESSCNPLKSLDDRKKAIEIIGEKNIECLEIYKFLISNAVTPKIKVRSKDDQFSGI